jgi:hypothetical protein
MLTARLADPTPLERSGGRVRIGKLWPLAAGLALIMAFVGLERTPPVRASFTLTGTVDCGRASGAACSLGDTIVIVSKDSGAPVKYTIDLGWLKTLPTLDQDDYVSIEIEKLQNGTLQALNLTDLSGQQGTGSPGVRAVKSTTTTTTNDDASVSADDCFGDIISSTEKGQTVSTTTFLDISTSGTGTATIGVTVTETSVTTIGITITNVSTLACNVRATTTTESTSSDPT